MRRAILLFGLMLMCSGCHHSRKSTRIHRDIPPPSSNIPPPITDFGVAGMAGIGGGGFGTAESVMAGVDAPPAPLKSSQPPGQHGHSTHTHFRRVIAEPQKASPEDAQQILVEQWYAGLLKGNVEYMVPSTMYWREGSTVTVVIRGPRAPKSTALVGATGSGVLKISDYMKVELSCPNNPDEFTIVPEPGTEPIQFVADNGSNEWAWKVTPKYTTGNKPSTIVIKAWLLYTKNGVLSKPNPNDDISRPIPAYTASIMVRVPGIIDCLKRLIEGDPQYWLRYGLPGGGGFIFIAGVFTWLKKRKARNQSSRSRRSNRKPRRSAGV